VKKKNPVPLLEFTSKGIYCSLANVYLDPWRPVAKAIISHGHADHARWGHKQYITHQDNVAILKHRLGAIVVSGKAYGETFSINNVTFSFHPSGHVIGAAQIRVEHRGEVWVFTGDYKIKNDGLTLPFEPVKCHTFITESTFGIPVFHWPDPVEVHTAINHWWAANNKAGRASLLLGYSLGKAQRLLHFLDPSIGPIYTHSAVGNMTAVFEGTHAFPPYQNLTAETSKKALAGSLILAPPAATEAAWLRKLGDYRSGFASGWMHTRGARRRRAVDQAFVLSDHADWPGLLAAVKATQCENVITTHGYTDLFAQYLREKGWNARTEKTNYEGESIDPKPTL